MREQWWEKGACRDANPAIFDGVVLRGGRPRKDGTRAIVRRDWSAARSMCGRCPVQPDCLEWALSTPESPWDDEAFVAGCTPEELREIKRRRRAS